MTKQHQSESKGGALKNPAELLCSQGIDAKRTNRGIVVSVFDIWDAPKSDPMWHPRSGDAINGALLYDIAKRGVREPVLLARMGLFNGKMRLAIAYGMQRTNHLREAVTRMKAGTPFRKFDGDVDTGETEVIPWTDGSHYIPVILHPKNDIKELLLERAKEDAQPFKRQHSPSVVAVSISQLRAVHATDAEIIAAHINPMRGIDKAIIVALERWGELSPDVQARFDDGAPIGLLPSVVDMPREDQMLTLDKYIEAGVKSKCGATRVRNREERAKGGGNGEAIRPSTIKKILADVTPTEEDIGSAREVYDSIRAKNTKPSAETADAIDTLVIEAFARGAAFRGGDLSAADVLPDDVRRKVKKAAKEQGRTGEKKVRDKKSAAAE